MMFARGLGTVLVLVSTTKGTLAVTKHQGMKEHDCCM
jgi:hypothetical protein